MLIELYFGLVFGVRSFDAAPNLVTGMDDSMVQANFIANPLARKQHCLTRSDVTSVERGVRMSQCGQAPLEMRIEGHFS